MCESLYSTFAIPVWLQEVSKLTGSLLSWSSEWVQSTSDILSKSNRLKERAQARIRMADSLAGVADAPVHR